ncbi:MAG: hypothetical protein AAB353_06525 [Candidatus Hydrogenedentota bacterium]
MGIRNGLAGLCVLAACALSAWAQQPPVVYENDFEKGIDGFEMTDANAWAAAEDESSRSKVLALVGSSKYEPPVRSPLNIARVKGLSVSDFTLEVDVRQTGKEYGHRDMCFFFGYEDPSHFYYVHLATKADDHANSIFIVNGAPRLSIAKERTDGTDWASGWHKIRITRDAASGVVEVFFDNMEKPVMRATDLTFPAGQIGFGSFDDVGNFDNVRIFGKKVDAKGSSTKP